MPPPPLIPREVILGSPTRGSPALSGDGTEIAYLASFEGTQNVWVTAADGTAPRPVTRHPRGVGKFFWPFDGRHILYLADRDGDEVIHVYAVDRASGEVRDLTPFDGVQARVLGLSRRFPDHILVSLNKRTPELQDAYRVNLTTGELTLVAENPGFASLQADADLRVRGGLSWTRGGGLAFHMREHEGAEWRILHEVDPVDALSCRPIGFTNDGQSVLLVSAAGADTGRLVRFSVSGGPAEVLFEDPRYDVVGVVTHPDTGQPQLAIVQRERTCLEVLDPAIEVHLERLRAIHDGDLKILDRDARDHIWLAQFIVDDGPAAYYTYDVRTGQATFVFNHLSTLENYPLAHMEPFAFAARDGLTIHGYLTFPPGSDRRRLPAVLKVHGGPWARDIWGFKAEAQWLANRGYLFIQVNFRGSTGYGKHFVSAGDREWGARMQDDLTDAVEWVVKQGFADPRRVAIMGGSYGGYAALMGATFTPDLFRCVIASAAPSNLNTFIRSIPPAWKPMVASFNARVGDPEVEADLWSRSPLSRVDQIRNPILISHGANDPRVKRSEAEQMVAAIRARGIECEYLLFPDEGHVLMRPENRMVFSAAVEAFLAQHLGGRCETSVQ